MNKLLDKKTKRKYRIRGRIVQHASRPRLVVTRSNSHIYGQIVDIKGKTLLSVSDIGLDKKGKTKTQLAKLVGQTLAKKALAQKINKVVFDKGPYAFHGRVKALAEGAREGLDF